MIGGKVIDISPPRARQPTENLESFGVGEPTVSKSGVSTGDTVHIEIDKDGNMVSATPSGGWLRSSPIIPESASASATGRRCSGSTSLAAGSGTERRPRTTLSSMAPGTEGYMAFGTLAVISGISAADAAAPCGPSVELQESIDCPAFHNEHFPSSFWPRGINLAALSSKAIHSKPSPNFKSAVTMCRLARIGLKAVCPAPAARGPC